MRGEALLLFGFEFVMIDSVILLLIIVFLTSGEFVYDEDDDDDNAMCEFRGKLSVCVRLKSK
jgi:hypothetical protein